MRYEILQVVEQGNLFQVKLKQPTFERKNNEDIVYNTRGEVTTFSRESRKRIIDMFATLDRAKLARKRKLFITLTYEWLMLDDERAKRDLKTFCERVMRKFPKASIVWRMEQQRSGSIHFHLILIGVGFWDVKKAQAAWNEICGGVARNSLDLKPIRSINGVMHYASKYVAKTSPDEWTRHNSKYDFMLAVMLFNVMRPLAVLLLGLSISHIFAPLPDLIGRRWGVYGRKNMPFAARTEKTVVTTLYAYLSAVAKIDNKYAVWWRSFTVYDSGAKSIYTRFCEEIGANWRNMFAQHTFRRRKQYFHSQANAYFNALEKSQRDEWLWLVYITQHPDYMLKKALLFMSGGD